MTILHTDISSTNYDDAFRLSLQLEHRIAGQIIYALNTFDWRQRGASTRNDEDHFSFYCMSANLQGIVRNEFAPVFEPCNVGCTFDCSSLMPSIVFDLGMHTLHDVTKVNCI